MAQVPISRASVGLTPAQRAVLSEMICRANDERRAAGLPADLGVREFFHLLLQMYAEQQGLEWPEDYPQHGGPRGGRE